MEPEEQKKEAAAEKTAAKPRAPRKAATRKTAPKAEGDAGTPAAATEKKKPARRKKTETSAAAPAAEAPAAAPKAEQPAPAQQPAPAVENAAPKQQKKMHTRVAKGENKPEPKPEHKGDNKPAPQENHKPEQQEPREQQVSRFMDEQPRTPDHVPGFAVPEVVGGNEGGNGGNGRRKRRRNRNRRGGDGNQPQQQNQPAPKVDPDELYRRAWKIFLGEVTEEGLALMDDRTAAEASRRAFRVAELFLLEAARHRPAANTPAPETAEEEETETPAEDGQE